MVLAHTLREGNGSSGKGLTSVAHAQPGHAWLTQHYKWALDRAFHERGHSHVIVVEDDMIFSPDFLTLFQVHIPEQQGPCTGFAHQPAWDVSPCQPGIIHGIGAGGCASSGAGPKHMVRVILE